MAAGSSSSSSSVPNYSYFPPQFCRVCVTGGIQGARLHCFASSLNGTVTLVSAVGPSDVSLYSISISSAANSRVSSVSSLLAEPRLCFLLSCARCPWVQVLKVFAALETGGEDPS